VSKIVFCKENDFRETPIAEIPVDWSFSKLDNLIEITTGKRAKGGGLDKGVVASIGGEHIDDRGNIQWDNMKFIPEDFYRFLKEGKVNMGDILLVKDGATTGKVALVRNLQYERVAVNEHVFVIRSKTDDLMNKFLFYFLFSKYGQIQIERRFHGIIGGILRSDLEKILIPLPPIQEQKKIAELLSFVDLAVAKTREVIAKTERLKKGLMQELLTKGIGHKEYKQTEIGKIPKEWQVAELGKTYDIYDCKHRTPKYIDKGYPIVRPRDVRPSLLNLENCLRTSLEDYNDLTKKYAPRKGDIVYTRNASFGVAGFVGSNKKFSIGQDVVVITSNQQSTKFLFYALNSEFMNLQVSRFSTGSTFKRINLQLIRKLRFALPSFQEQERIAEILTAVDSKLELERREKARLERVRLGLMDLLLTGKVRVKVD
jgi:type I restriction enzyme S subunit